MWVCVTAILRIALPETPEKGNPADIPDQSESVVRGGVLGVKARNLISKFAATLCWLGNVGSRLGKSSLFFESLSESDSGS